MVRGRANAIFEGRWNGGCGQGNTLWFEAFYGLLKSTSHPFSLEVLLQRIANENEAIFTSIGDKVPEEKRFRL
jgi:hypothetical protein